MCKCFSFFILNAVERTRQWHCTQYSVTAIWNRLVRINENKYWKKWMKNTKTKIDFSIWIWTVQQHIVWELAQFTIIRIGSTVWHCLCKCWVHSAHRRNMAHIRRIFLVAQSFDHGRSFDYGRRYPTARSIRWRSAYRSTRNHFQANDFGNQHSVGINLPPSPVPLFGQFITFPTEEIH